MAVQLNYQVVQSRMDNEYFRVKMDNRGYLAYQLIRQVPLCTVLEARTSNGWRQGLGRKAADAFIK